MLLQCVNDKSVSAAVGGEQMWCVSVCTVISLGWCVIYNTPGMQELCELKNLYFLDWFIVTAKEKRSKYKMLLGGVCFVFYLNTFFPIQSILSCNVSLRHAWVAQLISVFCSLQSTHPI